MSRPFRSVATALADWPRIDGVLRELGPFAECSMCQKEVTLGRRERAEWTTVMYGNKPTCFNHATDLEELHNNARYAEAAMRNLGMAAHEEREEESEDAETDDPRGT
jgi:hypothetical protein